MWPLLALYSRELEEDEEEEEEDAEQIEVSRFPELLFRNVPQLLHYTAALRSPYDGDHEDNDAGDSDEVFESFIKSREEFRLDTQIGTTKARSTIHQCVFFKIFHS